ncbi:MAG: tetratricopeptide repeat protein [Burkholderiales bacterium]
MRHADPEKDQAPKLREALRKAAASALVDLLEPVRDIRSHPKLGLELAHAAHLALPLSTADEAVLSLQIARVEIERGNYREALAISSKALPTLEKSLGPDHLDTLGMRLNIAGLTGETSDEAEALRLFCEVLKDQERVLGRNHRDSLRTRNNIARLVGKLGDIREALRLSGELLNEREQALRPDDRIY